MDSGAPTSGAWMESGLTFLLGGFQRFWTVDTNVGGAACSPGLEITTPQPDPKPGPKKASMQNASVVTCRDLRQLSGHGDGCPALRL